ncbi:hypothetical protein BP5796_08594 [Coleophoma crateriformis]|uniref:SET domain-containing protein n=1 Tax=Coleophoma crateriformis TaxID=565419 RepID=A0A3D8R827_9HELO|nr:hypothetical protein BP5796_08594 [Coleophoma crateriformis]
MWEIRLAGPKGLGVFAKSFIPRGTRIFSEKPLLAILQGQDTSALYNATKQLSPDDRASLLSLSAHVTKESSFIRWNKASWYVVKETILDLKAKLRGRNGAGNWRMPRFHAIGEHAAILSIFRSNAFKFGRTSQFHQAVFPRISRINHSCIPNAQGNFHDVLGKFNIHATRDIDADEELTLNYLQEHGALRAARQLQLLNDYGFSCDCSACDVVRGQEGEGKRTQMLNVLRTFAEGAAQEDTQNPGEELRTMQLFINLLEGEGIAGREVATM